jgi:hypothetical protein
MTPSRSFTRTRHAAYVASARARAALVACLGAASIVATGIAANAQAVPAAKPPNPTANQTSQLIWNAMSATARAAATNPSAAQAANFDTNAAIERYHQHDLAGARAAALQALIDANRPATANAVPLRPIAPTRAYVQTAPPPLNLSAIPEVDADGFIARARGSLQACREEHSSNTAAATEQLDAAAHDYQAEKFAAAQAEAKRAIDLCAPALRAINLRTP